ncbi:MAG: RHS repeat protein [Chloroflexi bacterium]|nr:RHS repeat protein [Chloroflexota bacterium]
MSTTFDLDLRAGLPTMLAAGGRTYLPGMASLGFADGTAWTSALTDVQGSVLRHIDSAGTMTALTRYDPCGPRAAPACRRVSATPVTGRCDPVGNLTSITSPSGTTNHTYDAADRLSDTGSATTTTAHCCLTAPGPSPMTHWPD